MIENPIVDEIHRNRGEIVAEYGDDIPAMICNDQRKTEELAKADRVVVTRGPRPVEPQEVPARKFG